MQLYGIGEIYKRTHDTVTEAIRLLMSNLKVHFCTLMLMCGELAGVDLLFLKDFVVFFVWIKAPNSVQRFI